jgi:hypothetical protein
MSEHFLGRRAFTLAAPSLLWSACGAGRVPLHESSRTYTASEYEGVYRRWTRSADDFALGRFSEVLHVTATFESWEFRWAYVVRYASDHSFTIDERTRLLEESLADSRVRHRFFVTLAVPIWREGDLTGRQSDIRVLLVDASGKQVEPIELTRISRPTVDQRIYFPSINKQRHTYRLAFPVQGEDGTPLLSPDSDHALLRFASAAGTVDLRWELEREPVSTSPP